MKNILVLDANGFIGSHLIKKIIPAANVIGYDINLPGADIQFKLIQGDFGHGRTKVESLYYNRGRN